MKKLFTLIAIMFSVVASAQVTEMQSATLTLKDGTTTVYYGQDALVKAYNAAPNKDATITLSSGDFQSVQWRKAVNLYGVGFEEDATTRTSRTYLTGGMEFLPQDSRNIDNIHIEGIFFNGNITLSNNANNEGAPITGIVFARCYYSSFVINTNTKDIVIRQSVNTGDIGGNTNYLQDNLRILNSWVGGRAVSIPTNETYMSTVLFDHCLINKWWSSTNYGWNQPQGPYRFTNCIIRQNVSAGASWENCILLAYEKADPQTTTENCIYGAGKALIAFFEEDVENMDYSATRTYKLVDKYATAGTDGTEIGLHGGYGWIKTSSVPRITEISIDKQTSTDGILKVFLKAEAQPVVQ